MKYELFNGEYHLFNNGEFILNAGSAVSFSYTYEIDEDNKKTAVIYKHGHYDRVLELHNQFVILMNQNNIKNKSILFDVDIQFMMTISPSIDELDKLLSCTGYIAKYHEALYVK